MTVQIKRIAPTFVHCGVESGGAAAVVPLIWQGEECIIVGSKTGRCILFSLRSFRRRVVWIDEHAQQRQIVAMGKWRFSVDVGEVENSLLIWIHFRGKAVEVFQLDAVEPRLTQHSRHINTGHYGFCQADGVNVIKVTYKAGGEKCVRIEEKFLVHSYLSCSMPRTLDSEQVEVIGPFKGMLMGLQPANFLSLKSQPKAYLTTNDFKDGVFMAFEDSTIALYNFRLKQVIDFVKHPKHHQFVCWAVRSFYDDDSEICRRCFFAISTLKQVYLVAFDLTKLSFEVCCVIRKTMSITCTALELFTSCDGQHSVACGLASGTVEIYSLGLRPDSSGCIAKPTLFAVSDFQADHSITCVVWASWPSKIVAESTSTRPTDDESSKKSITPVRTPLNLLIVGCSAGKLAQYIV